MICNFANFPKWMMRLWEIVELVEMEPSLVSRFDGYGCHFILLIYSGRKYKRVYIFTRTRCIFFGSKCNFSPSLFLFLYISVVRGEYRENFSTLKLTPSLRFLFYPLNWKIHLYFVLLFQPHLLLTLFYVAIYLQLYLKFTLGWITGNRCILPENI